MTLTGTGGVGIRRGRRVPGFAEVAAAVGDGAGDCSYDAAQTDSAG